MNKFKAMIIRSSMNFIIENEGDKSLDIRLSTPVKVKDEYSQYLYLLDDISLIINGINAVEVNIDDLRVEIFYDKQIISINNIKSILDDLKEFIIENWDYISENEENVDEVIKTLKLKFRDRYLKINYTD